LKYLAWLAKNFFQETMAWVRTEKKRTDRHVRRIQSVGRKRLGR
jgi:hypothetical protein